MFSMPILFSLFFYASQFNPNYLYSLLLLGSFYPELTYLSLAQLCYSWERSLAARSSIATDCGVDSMCLGEFLFLPSLLYMAMDAWLPPHPQMLCCFYPLSFICQEARNPISYVFFLVLLMDAM
jgi:hypothetical protein